jgi:hypothetical protein
MSELLSKRQAAVAARKSAGPAAPQAKSPAPQMRLTEQDAANPADLSQFNNGPTIGGEAQAEAA